MASFLSSGCLVSKYKDSNILTRKHILRILGQIALCCTLKNRRLLIVNLDVSLCAFIHANIAALQSAHSFSIYHLLHSKKSESSILTTSKRDFVFLHSEVAYISIWLPFRHPSLFKTCTQVHRIFLKMQVYLCMDQLLNLSSILSPRNSEWNFSLMTKLRSRWSWETVACSGSPNELHGSPWIHI